jgi:hypothetical protein
VNVHWFFGNRAITSCLACWLLCLDSLRFKSTNYRFQKQHRKQGNPERNIWNSSNPEGFDAEPQTSAQQPYNLESLKEG